MKWNMPIDSLAPIVSILNNATQVLRLLARSEHDLSVTHVASALNLPKSSASRLLKQMQGCGLLERDNGTLAYRPALLLLEVSHQVRATTSLLHQLEPVIESLVHASGHTGYISVLDETCTHIVVLRVHHGSHPLRVVTWPGHRSPAIATSTGRALLARLSDHEIDARFEALAADSLPSSPRSLAELHAALNDVRKNGYAAAYDEAIPGVSSLSCSVADPATGEALAFCLSFPSNPDATGQTDPLIQELTTQARTLGRAIGDPFWTHQALTDADTTLQDTRDHS